MFLRRTCAALAVLAVAACTDVGSDIVAKLPDATPIDALIFVDAPPPVDAAVVDSAAPDAAAPLDAQAIDAPALPPDAAAASAVEWQSLASVPPIQQGWRAPRR